MQALRTKFSQQCPVYTISATTRTSGAFSLSRSLAMSPTSCSSLPRPVKTESTKPVGYRKLSSSTEVLNDTTPDLVHLRIESDCKSKKIADLEKEMESITLELENCRAELHQERNSKQLRSLKEQLLYERSEKELFIERASNMVSEITQLRERVGEVQIENEEINQRLVSAHTEIDKSRLEIAQLKEKCDCIQVEYDGAVKDLDAKLCITTAEKTALEKQIAEQTNSILLKSAEEDAEVEQLKNGLEDAITQLGITTARLSTTRAEKTVLEEQYREQALLNSSTERALDSLQQEHDNAITELGVSTARLSLTRAEKRMVTEKVPSREEELENGLDTAVTELGITTARLSLTRAEKRLLEEKVTSKKYSDDGKDGLDAALTELGTTTARLSLARAEKRLLAEKVTNNEVEHLKNGLDAAVTELGINTAKLSLTRAEKRMLEEQVMLQSSSVVSSSQTAMEQLQHKLDAATTELGIATARLSTARAEKKLLEERYVEQSKAILVIDSEAEDITWYRIELERTSEILSETKADMEKLELEKQELVQAYNLQLEISSQIEIRLSTEKETLMQRVADAEESLQALRQEHHTEMREMEAKLSADIGHLQSQLAKIANEKQNLLRQIDEVLEDISDDTSNVRR